MIKNHFTLVQLKKMIGKKVVILWRGIVPGAQEKARAKSLKASLIKRAGGQKHQLVVTAVCIGGVLHVIKNEDVYLAIESMPYKTLEAMSNMVITMIQHPEMTKQEIKGLI